MFQFRLKPEPAGDTADGHHSHKVERLAAPFNLDTLFQIIVMTAYPIEHTTRYSLVFKSVNMNECSGAIKPGFVFVLYE